MASTDWRLVGDIGGTNARFARAFAADGGVRLEDVRQYPAADFPTLTDAAQHFLRAAAPSSAPREAVLAIASAVSGDHIKITNNPWTFSRRQLADELGFAVTLINDFAAVSTALPSLAAADLLRLGTASPSPEARARRCYVVVGPGTGLGVGGLVVDGAQRTVIESEGGHIGFAPADDFDHELLAVLRPRYGRVSAERLLSGAGLVNLYTALCAITGLPPEPNVTPEEITARGNDDPHGLCARVLDVAARLLGSFAGDMALAFGAWDGVFLHGGVAQALRPWLERPVFRERFEAKGRHQALMQRIATQLILHPHAGLLGAAVHLPRA